jgi:hypothetical protein
VTTSSADLAKLLAGNFIERRDVKAIQIQTGEYQPHRVGPQPRYADRPLVPFDLASLVAHVEGTQTFGHYLVKPDTQTARCFVFDIDLNESSSYHDPELKQTFQINPREEWMRSGTTCKKDLALQLFAMADGLAKRTDTLVGCKVMVAYSGNKGLHVIGCPGPGTPAVECRNLAMMVLDSLHCFEPLKGKNFYKHSTGYPSLEVEIYPKQEEVRSDGFGNLVRLPLGINRKNPNTNNKGFFLRMDVPFGTFAIDDPQETLERGSLRNGPDKTTG